MSANSPTPRLRDIFELAVATPPHKRAALLDRLCGADTDLRRRADALLAGDGAPTHSLLRPGRVLDSLTPGSQAPEESGLIRRLARMRAMAPLVLDRYELCEELGRGGMGAVIRVEDLDLGRSLAMKVILGDPHSTSVVSPDSEIFQRFLQEAKIVGQLDHPGVVPIHELGIDANNRPYFTMKLVRGRTAGLIFDLCRARTDGWTLTRGLEVILKMCDALSFAHEKGVLHRDIKPHNVMVGTFGEVYVMDWGIAKVLGVHRPPNPDSLANGTVSHNPAPLRPDVQLLAGQPPSPISALPSPTLDGAVLGTPSYMSPEQATGRSAAIGPPSDIYAVGAVLYRLLTGRDPYVDPGSDSSPEAVLAAVRQRAPLPIPAIDPSIPAELVAICDRAMARNPDRRYASMHAFADDIRAYLEQRVVQAYRTGAYAELRSWVRRHRSMALALCAVALSVLAGTVVSLYYAAEAEERGLAAQTSALEAKNNEAEAKSALADFHRMADIQRLRDLELAARDELWPAHPSKIANFEEWLLHADQLIGRLELHRKTLIALEETIAGSEVQVPAEITWQRDILKTLVGDLDIFRTRGSNSTYWSVRRRVDLARALEEKSISSRKEKWDEAIRSISDPQECPLYQGLRIVPQIGLVPLGRNRTTGLWEFWHVQSGSRPRWRERDGNAAMDMDTGMVLVLLPGGSFWMGAQGRNQRDPNYDPNALPNEEPIISVALEAFFISRFEMTNSQWLRWTGQNPSGPHAAEVTHPVCQVSWDDCRQVCMEMGLELPTEAQWEYACRAGTSTPYWSGSGKPALALKGVANIADESIQAAFTQFNERYARTLVPSDYERGLNDGHVAAAPVGSLRGNPWGLCDVHGNVGEWCRDVYCPYIVSPQRGDGQRVTDEMPERVVRGGSWYSAALHVRTAQRSGGPLRHQAFPQVGLRPSRSLTEY
ncbi:MAG: SUMF1/EgtB/PvdO family nonheme iron enzyme [Planctomycetes bacterium]|nr:SUMF1/EgtB/PvdO family nonheme iron enzyme [Planctomycetota bacterium]